MKIIIGDSVFVAAEPLHLSYPEHGNVLEGEVERIEQIITADATGKKTRTQITISTSLDTIVRLEDSVYLDKKQANEAANSLIGEAADRMRRNLEVLEKCEAANIAS